MIKIELYNKILEFDNRESMLEHLTRYELKLNDNGDIIKTEDIGCIPGILNIWFDKRVEYKGLMKKYGIANDTDKYNYYNKRQHVQKILLNSLYGVLGLPGWRFYDVDNAGATTGSGQLIIKSTADMGNTKNNNEINSPHRVQVELEDNTIKQYKLTEYIKVVRNGELAEIMAKDLVMTDELS